MGKKRRGARWKQQKAERKRKKQAKVDAVLARPVNMDTGWAGLMKRGGRNCFMELRVIDGGLSDSPGEPPADGDATND